MADFGMVDTDINRKMTVILGRAFLTDAITLIDTSRREDDLAVSVKNSKCLLVPVVTLSSSLLIVPINLIPFATMLRLSLRLTMLKTCLPSYL